MRRAFTLLACTVLAATVSIGAAAQPHLVDRWALYLGSPSDAGHAQLYLDPFPNAVSCESRARLLRNNSERAFCASHRQLAFGSRLDAILAADFARLTFGGAYCAPKRKAAAATP